MIKTLQRLIRVPQDLWGQLASEELSRAAEDLVNRYGGVNGVVKRMEHLGLGEVAHSWVGNEVRQPIYSEQLHALFGTNVLRAMAAQLDLTPRDLVRHLSQALPRAIHRLAACVRPAGPASRWLSQPQ